MVKKAGSRKRKFVQSKPYKDTSTPSIYMFFRPTLSKRAKRATNVINSAEKKAPSVGISWRPDGSGKGSRYDHATYQIITNFETKAIAPEHETTSNLSHALKQLTYQLKHGSMSDRFNCKIPETCDGLSNTLGLLVLPGVSSSEFKTADYQLRKHREIGLINKARNCGQPILAVCGGSWVLYEAYGGKIVPVKDHNYRGGMPRLSETTAQVTHNKMIHRIQINPAAKILEASLDIRKAKETPLPVNSVHSYAPSAKVIPEGLIVSATAQQDDTIAPINPHCPYKSLLKPAQSIEAFESVSGAPVLGVQWHPEASANQQESGPDVHQKNLLRWMGLAGQTYLARQDVNQQIKSDLPELKFIGLLDHFAVRHNTSKAGTKLTIYKQKKFSLRHKDEAQLEIQHKEKYLEEKRKEKYLAEKRKQKYLAQKRLFKYSPRCQVWKEISTAALTEFCPPTINKQA